MSYLSITCKHFDVQGFWFPFRYVKGNPCNKFHWEKLQSPDKVTDALFNLMVHKQDINLQLTRIQPFFACCLFSMEFLWLH